MPSTKIKKEYLLYINPNAKKEAFVLVGSYEKCIDEGCSCTKEAFNIYNDAYKEENINLAKKLGYEKYYYPIHMDIEDNISHRIYIEEGKAIKEEKN